LGYDLGDLNWAEAGSRSGGDDVTSWIRKVMVVIMAIFIMVSIVLGSLAFKQLAADGNWKDFWSKIAGAIGMFIVPVVVYWLVAQ
jgi:preprotein translocase subunit SecG